MNCYVVVPKHQRHQTTSLLLCFCITMVTMLLLSVAKVNGMTLKTVQKLFDFKESLEFEQAKDRSLLITLHDNRPSVHYTFLNRLTNYTKFTYISITSCTAELHYHFVKEFVPLSGPSWTSGSASGSIVEEHKLTESIKHASEPTKFQSQVTNTDKIDHELLTAGHNLIMVSFAQNTRSQQSPLPQKAIIKIGGDETLDFGYGRYDQMICADDATGSSEKRRLSVMINLRDYTRRAKVCVVVNTVRPLSQYCSAQIALGNRLPYPRDGLLSGVEALQLSPGDYVFECVDNVNNNRLLKATVNTAEMLSRSNPHRLYINTYIVERDQDGQAKPFSWDTVTYYRSGPLLPCKIYETKMESRVADTLTETSPGVFQGLVVLKLHQDRLLAHSSLFLRATHFNLLSPHFRVRLTPYSSVSAHFNYSRYVCEDVMTAAGTSPCNFSAVCDSNSHFLCQFDRWRVEVSSENKVTSRQQRIAYGENKKNSILKRDFDWIIFDKSKLSSTLVKPLLGQPDQTLSVIKSLHDFSINCTEPEYGTHHRCNMRTKKQFTNLYKFCHKLFNRTVFPVRNSRMSSAVDRLEKQSVKCYAGLLKLHVKFYLGCPAVVGIYSRDYSPFTADFNVRENHYMYFIFRVHVNPRYQDQANSNKKKIKRAIEQRLMRTLSTSQPPNNRNQGFKEHPERRRMRRVRHRGSGRLSADRVIESLQLVSSFTDVGVLVTKHTIPINKFDGEASVDQFLAIYVYAQPADSADKGRVSLFGFLVQPLSKLFSKICRSKQN